MFDTLKAYLHLSPYQYDALLYVSVATLIAISVAWFIRRKLTVTGLFRFFASDVDSGVTDFTSCRSPDCVRCGKYAVVKDKARERLQQFVVQAGALYCHKLDRLRSIHSITEDFHYEVQSQRPNILYLPFLTSVPWWETNHFQEDVTMLEDSFEIIENECFSVFEDYSLPEGGWSRNTTESGCWGTFYFYNQGILNRQNADKCPQTSRLIQNLRLIMKNCIFANVLFSVLHPNTTIAEHYGPTNNRIRCHLGIQIPDGCFLEVGKEKRIWKEGKCTLFDDSFIHSASYQRPDGYPRIVFMLDFWHPQLTDFEKKALEFIFEP